MIIRISTSNPVRDLISVVLLSILYAYGITNYSGRFADNH